MMEILNLIKFRLNYSLHKKDIHNSKPYTKKLVNITTLQPRRMRHQFLNNHVISLHV